MRQACCTVAAFAILAASGCQHNNFTEVEPEIIESGTATSTATHGATMSGNTQIREPETLEHAEYGSGFGNIDAQIAWLAEAAVLSAKSNEEFDPLAVEAASSTDAAARVAEAGPRLVPAVQEAVASDAGSELPAPAARETQLAELETGASLGRTSAERMISDEQDFEAVSSRETIESDARRRHEYRDNRLVYTPDELPEPGAGPNVARYALTTTHDVGTRVYRRFVFANVGWEERCAGFADDDVAQREFLSAGGPLRDTMRLDPDGDGFACGWTPEIYRRMLQ